MKEQDSKHKLFRKATIRRVEVIFHISMIMILLVPMARPVLVFAQESDTAVENESIVTTNEVIDTADTGEVQVSNAEESSPSEEQVTQEDVPEEVSEIVTEEEIIPEVEEVQEETETILKDVEETTEEDTTIETGDASGSTVIGNNVNTTDVPLDPCGECLTEDSQDTAASTPEFLDENPDVDISLDVENEAEVVNDVEADVNSGINSVAENAADVYITTGDVNAYTDIANFINTTIAGMGDIDVINIYDAVGTLDFSGFNPESANDDNSDGHQKGNDVDLDIDIDNDADVSNDVNVDANSGLNVVSGVNGNVHIITGDVNASTSVFNLVNSSFVGKDWTFKVINIYSSWIGDLILPTLYGNGNAVGCSGCLDSLTANIHNTASVTNTVDVDANSGNNDVSDVSGNITINSGNVFAQTSLFNLVNSSIIGNDWFYTNFNISGYWQGTVYNSTPSTVTTGDDSNFVLFGSKDPTDNGSTTDDFDNSLDVDVNNDATVTTDVDVNANSGSNTVFDVDGDVTIDTGDVIANTAVTNLVNTTLIGNGWQFFLVNIFGNWQGNLHYGMPDLALSEVAIPESFPVRRYSRVDFVLSYTNGGDAPATDVVLVDTFDPGIVSVDETPGATIGEDTITWDLGTINPGETKVVSYSTHVHHETTGDKVMNTAAIVGTNSDRNENNNVTGGALQIAVNHEHPYYSTGWEADPDITLVKKTKQDIYVSGETMEFTIEVDNHSLGKGYSVGLFDDLFDPDGVLAVSESWNLETIAPKEHIEVIYEVPIPANVKPGDYVNTVTLYSLNAYNKEMEPVYAEVPFTIVNEGYIDGADMDGFGGESPFEVLGFMGDLKKDMNSEEAGGDDSMFDLNEAIEGAIALVNPNTDADSGNGSVNGALLFGKKADPLTDSPTVLGASYQITRLNNGAQNEYDTQRNNSLSVIGLSAAIAMILVISLYMIRRYKGPLSHDKLKV